MLKLKEAANVRSGLVLSRKESAMPSQFSYRLLNLRGICSNGVIDFQHIDVFYAKEPLDTEYLTHEDDIIIRLSQPYTAILIDLSSCGMVISSNFAIIRADKRLLLPEYLLWLLNTAGIKQKLYENASSNMLGAIKPKYFAEIDLTPLSLQEQQQIANLNMLARKEIQLLHELADLKETYYAKSIDQIQKKMRSRGKEHDGKK